MVGLCEQGGLSPCLMPLHPVPWHALADTLEETRGVLYDAFGLDVLDLERVPLRCEAQYGDAVEAWREASEHDDSEHDDPELDASGRDSSKLYLCVALSGRRGGGQLRSVPATSPHARAGAAPGGSIDSDGSDFAPRSRVQKARRRGLNAAAALVYTSHYVLWVAAPARSGLAGVRRDAARDWAAVNLHLGRRTKLEGEDGDEAGCAPSRVRMVLLMYMARSVMPDYAANSTNAAWERCRLLSKPATATLYGLFMMGGLDGGWDVAMKDMDCTTALLPGRCAPPAAGSGPPHPAMAEQRESLRVVLAADMEPSIAQEGCDPITLSHWESALERALRAAENDDRMRGDVLGKFLAEYVSSATR